MTTLVPKYDQGATSAVNRPFNEKLAEVVSIADFGASPSASAAVNNAAIVAALAASDAIFIPAGNYSITGNINIFAKSVYGVSSNVSILTLSGTNTNTSLFINGGSILTPWGQGQGCELRNISLVGNWDGSTANTETDISLIGGLVKWWAGNQIHIFSCNMYSSYGFGFFCYQMGYSDLHDCHINTCAKNGVHVEAPSGNLAITSSSINQSNVNSIRGTGATGGSAIAITNGFFFNVNGCTLEDVDVGVRIDGADNRSITIFESHTESTTTAGVYYVGSGTDLMLFQNVFATAPYFVQTNPQFQTYAAIGNYQLPDLYALPVETANAAVVDLTNAAPSKTLNSLALTAGTWLITANWIGQQRSGSGQ